MEPETELPETLTLVLTQDQIITNMTALQFCLTVLGEEDLEVKIKLANLHKDIVYQVEEQVAESLEEKEDPALDA